MNEDIADALHFFPRNMGIFFLDFIGDSSSGFT